jgi:hypothetical protein
MSPAKCMEILRKGTHGLCGFPLLTFPISKEIIDGHLKIFFILNDRVSLYSLSWPRTHNFLALTSQVLGVASATTPDLSVYFYFLYK